MQTVRERQLSQKQLQKRRQSQVKQQKLPDLALQSKLSMAIDKDFQRLYAKQLSYNICKFQRSRLHLDDEEMIQEAMKIIKNFSQVDSNFKDLFKALHAELRLAIFIGHDTVAERYHFCEGTSYRKAVTVLDKEMRDAFIIKDQLIKYLQAQIDWLKQHSVNAETAYKEVNDRLREQVALYRKKADIESLKILEIEIKSLTETLSSQKDSYFCLEKEYKTAKQQIKQLKEQVNSEIGEVKELRDRIYDLEVHKEKTELYLLNMRDRFDQLMAKMITIKDHIRKVEEENEQLATQRARLVGRAAVAFDELTPRPKYSAIFDLPPTTKLSSTCEIFSKVLQLCSSKIQAKKCVLQEVRSSKLAACEQVRSCVVQDIHLAKHQLRGLI